MIHLSGDREHLVNQVEIVVKVSKRFQNLLLRHSTVPHLIPMHRGLCQPYAQHAQLVSQW
jgi:hypothetical protein